MRFGNRTNAVRPRVFDGDRLIADAEAALAGVYEDHLRRRSRRVPGWARLNRFAHGDLRVLHQAKRPFAATSSTTVADWTQEAWRSAQGILAIEVLELVGEDPTRLVELQRMVLIPLELELMDDESNCRLTALELVQCTRLALRSCPL